MFCIIIGEMDEVIGSFSSIEEAENWINFYYINDLKPNLIIKEIKTLPIPLMNYFLYLEMRGKI